MGLQLDWVSWIEIQYFPLAVEEVKDELIRNLRCSSHEAEQGLLIWFT